MTDVLVARLTEFKAQLESTNEISTNHILSIEQAVGSAFITTKTPLGKFSTNPSRMGVTEVIEDTIAYIELLTKDTETPIQVAVTYEELVEVQHSVLRKVTWLLDKITQFSTIPHEALDRLVNEKYIWTYTDANRNERTEVVDLTSDRNVIDVFSFNMDYVNAVLVATGRSPDVINNTLTFIANRLSEYNNSIYKEDGTMLHSTPVLLGTCIKSEISELLYSNAVYHIDYITIRDMLELFLNINKVTKDLTDLIDRIKWDISSGRDSASWVYFNDYKQLYKDYKRYSTFNTLLDDKASNIILDIFASLLNLRK